MIATSSCGEGTWAGVVEATKAAIAHAEIAGRPARLGLTSAEQVHSAGGTVTVVATTSMAIFTTVTGSSSGCTPDETL